MNFRTEILSAELTKYVLHFNEEVKGPFEIMVHHFSGKDKGKPHDHPFGFTSYIAFGGYIEKVYHIEGDKVRTELIHRKPGDVFNVKATHIHELIDLPQGQCFTVVIPQMWERDWRFWKFDADAISSRAWHEKDYTPLITPA